MDTMTQELYKINKISLKTLYFLHSHHNAAKRNFGLCNPLWHVLSLWDYEDDILDSVNPASEFGQKPRTPT